jgi:hypothetical protein
MPENLTKKELKALKDQAFEMYIEGYSYTEIGDKIGRDKSRISRWALLGDWRKRKQAIQQGEEDPAETKALVILPDESLSEKELDEHISDISRGLLHYAKEAVMEGNIDFHNPYQIMVVLEFAAREMHLRRGEPTEINQMNHLGVLSEDDKQALREGLHLLLEHQTDIIDAELIEDGRE